MVAPPMNRRNGLKILGTATVGYALFKLSGINIMENFSKDSDGQRMPLLFIGHGSPMNAIEKNPYSLRLTEMGKELGKPKSILVISAHWMTQGTWVTEMERPKTIHDFYGFPKALHSVQYPAPGSPALAALVKKNIHTPVISGDLDSWGLDHGTWAVLRHMYPEADVPVVQLSLDLSQGPAYHFEIGQQLSQLRDQGVLILASGNLVHNLRQIRWEANAKPYDWAIEFDSWVKQKLEDRDFDALMYDFLKSTAGQLSHPSVDHYFPLPYILGAARADDPLRFEYEELQNGSVSMRSFRFG